MTKEIAVPHGAYNVEMLIFKKQKTKTKAKCE